MPITYVGAGPVKALTPAASSIDIVLPSNMQDNDYCMIALTNNVTGPPTTPSGWTQLATVAASGVTTPNLTIYGRYVTAVMSGSTQTILKASGTANGFALAFRGVDLTTAMDVTRTTLSSGAATAYNVPALTPVTAGAAFVVFASANGAGTWTPPTNRPFTEVLDVATVTPGLTVDYSLPNLAAGVSSGIFNLVRSSSIRGSAVAVALRPAPAAGGPAAFTGWGIPI